MPYKEKEIKKMFYSIGEVADMFNVKTSHIRFWSKQFSVIKPATNKKGNRLFTEQDIENLKVIYHLVKEKGFTLKGAKVEMQVMRKKMKIEHNPQNAIDATSTSSPANELQFNESVSSTDTNAANDFVDKIAIKNSLLKIKTALLQIQNELTLMQE